MHTRTRTYRGFTLLEVMSAVVILIILSALAATFMVYGMGRARMNNAVFDAAALINSAQLRAVSRGTPHYIFLRQTADGRVRIHLLERPDAPRLSPAQWAALDLSEGPEKALEFNNTLPDGTVVVSNALARDQLVLGSSIGPDSGGLAFLDLDSTRIRKPLPAPFRAIPLTTTASSANPDMPTSDLMAGCNFCINPSGEEPYGVLRFNSDGTMEVLTGNAPSGAVIAFAPNTRNETGIDPRLLAVSAPAGTTVVF
jgi:prepilin-type N-terminal cleavage/methylation domain-containing protein